MQFLPYAVFFICPHINSVNRGMSAPRLLEKIQSQCAITLIDVLQVLQQIQHNARAMNE